jgi:hypothetical protein
MVEKKETADIDPKLAEAVEKARKSIELLTSAGFESVDMETLVAMMEDKELEPIINQMLSDEDVFGLAEMAGIETEWPIDKIQLPEVEISAERDLLTNPEKKDELPQEIRDIIGDFKSFWEAMDDEDGKTCNKFIKELEKLKKTVDPALFSEMLVIAAETSWEVYSFLNDIKAKSWHHAVGNHEVFKTFMKGSWFIQINDYKETRPFMPELLIAAARTSKENAEWFLDKAKRDEEGGPMLEEPAYNLRESIDKEAFDRVMAAAKQTLKEE